MPSRLPRQQMLVSTSSSQGRGQRRPLSTTPDSVDLGFKSGPGDDTIMHGTEDSMRLIRDPPSSKRASNHSEVHNAQRNSKASDSNDDGNVQRQSTMMGRYAVGGKSTHKSSGVPPARGLPSNGSHRRAAKRSSDGDPPPPDAHRLRLGRQSGHQLKDEAWIRQTLQLPKPEAYPNAPPLLFTDPKGCLLNAPASIFSLESDIKPFGGKSFRCTMTINLPGQESRFVVAEGSTKKAADRAAYLAVLADLHNTGVLERMYATGVKLDKQVMADEVDAKMDIYNYAARFNTVPRFDVQEKRVRGKKIVMVTVELQEQGIQVTGEGGTLRAAEITASVLFKAAAEKYHAKHGDDNIIIKDSSALNTGNVKNFFEYYSLVRRLDILTMTCGVAHGLLSKGIPGFRAQAMRNGAPIGEPATMGTKKKTEELAWLTAAVVLVKEEPDLMTGFQRAMKAGNGDILQPVSPVSLVIESESAVIMRETIHEARKAGLTDLHEEVISEADTNATRTQRPFRRPANEAQAEIRSAALGAQLQAYNAKTDLAEMRRKRAELPMNQYRAQVLELIENNMYSIVVGATGSGKTTQVPQILLENMVAKGQGAHCNIICTQPRRIAATSVARRVAEERGESLQDTIGYQVRFDARIAKDAGSVNYCTTGILLQQLQHSPDEVMDSLSHIIIDEVHERDILIDFLLIILKKVMADRVREGKRTPNVVLMSATMDTDLFAGYFQTQHADGRTTGCPSVSVPGRTFPVKDIFLDDLLNTLRASYPDQLRALSEDPFTDEYMQVERDFRPTRTVAVGDAAEEGETDAAIDWKAERIVSADGEVAVVNDREEALVPFALVGLAIAHIAKTSTEGAVLVFLPGLDHILKVDAFLREKRPLGIDFTDESKFKLSMLHSSLPSGQTEVFNPVPAGCRKVILATNIAETSITIPDVQYVVDTGKLREKRYDQIRRITKLQCTWISKSNSKQRAGRAGRVQNGNYYGLYSRARFNDMRAIGLPEMLRSDLQEICLDIKAQAFRTPIRDFLAQAIEPPPARAVDASVTALQGLEALTEEEQLTPLGRLLASLPVHPSLGKMIVLGVIFRCLDPMLIIGASGAERPVFMSPPGARREADEIRARFAKDTGSDHIALINAIREMRAVRDRGGLSSLSQFAYANFLHLGAFKSIESTAKQIEEILVEAKLIPSTSRREQHQSQLGHPTLNENSGKVPLIKALALAGMHPNLAVNSFSRIFRTPGEKATVVHPSSINYNRLKSDGDLYPRGTLLTYSSMMTAATGNQILLRETSQTSPLMAALFGGRIRSTARSQHILEMDDWLPFYVRDHADRRALKTVVEFRKSLDRMLSGAFRDLGRNHGPSQGFLADEKARTIFAQGLVEVLDHDFDVNTWHRRQRDQAQSSRRETRDFGVGGSGRQGVDSYRASPNQGRPGVDSSRASPNQGRPGVDSSRASPNQGRSGVESYQPSPNQGRFGSQDPWSAAAQGSSLSHSSWR